MLQKLEWKNRTQTFMGPLKYGVLKAPLDNQSTAQVIVRHHDAGILEEMKCAIALHNYS